MPVLMRNNTVRFTKADMSELVQIAEQLWEQLDLAEPPLVAMGFGRTFDVEKVDRPGFKYCYVDVFGRRLQTQNIRKLRSPNTRAIRNEASKGGQLRITWILEDGFKGKIIVKKNLLGALHQVWSLTPDVLQYDKRYRNSV